MSIGAGGIPKTMIASGPPGLPGMPPAPPQGMPMGMQQMMPAGPPGMPGAPPLPGMPPMSGGMAPPMRGAPDQAKTMIAGQSPFAGGMLPGGMPMGAPGMPPGGMPMGAPPGMPQHGPPPGPGGYSPASPVQKTIVAGIAPPIMGGQMMPHGPGGQMMPPGYPSMPQMPPGGAGAGPNKTVMLQPSEGVVSVARTGQAVQPVGTGAIQPGASTLFWIVSLVVGVAVGALAYVVVLQL
jgi:hypothetical protein